MLEKRKRMPNKEVQIRKNVYSFRKEQKFSDTFIERQFYDFFILRQSGINAESIKYQESEVQDIKLQ